MSIIQKLVKVINAGDENGAKEVMHDDFKFLMHASGKTLSKDCLLYTSPSPRD